MGGDVLSCPFDPRDSGGDRFELSVKDFRAAHRRAGRFVSHNFFVLALCLRNFPHLPDYLRQPIETHDLNLGVVKQCWDCGLLGLDHYTTRVLMPQVAKYAKYDRATVILGETGVGKDLVARCLHRLSSRRKKPFQILNCGSIPGELAESELFGHEKGAFTGAVQRKKGAFELADGGILFLDEFGDLPPALQVKLLRVVEDGLVRRLGGEKDIPVNVRLVAATNQDVQTLVDKGRFRRDLYARMARLVIHVWPLYLRPADLPLLTEFVVRRFYQAHSGTEHSDSQLTEINGWLLAEILMDRWRDNVRGLTAKLEELCIHFRGPWQLLRDVDKRYFDVSLFDVKKLVDAYRDAPFAIDGLSTLPTDKFLGKLDDMRLNRSSENWTLESRFGQLDEEFALALPAGDRQPDASLDHAAMGPPQKDPFDQIANLDFATVQKLYALKRKELYRSWRRAAQGTGVADKTLKAWSNR